MSVYNGGAHVRDAIGSVLSQTCGDFEFLIIDDASSDNSLSIIQSFADPRIKIIENRNNLGLTASLNVGLRQASGEWIARLDADDMMLPARLQTQLQYVERRRCSVCFSQAVARDETNGTETVWRTPPWPLAVWTSLFSNLYGIHPTVMFRKSRIMEMGGYDEAFPQAQDYDLFDRLCAADEVFGYVEEPLIVYRRHGNRISVKGLDHQEQCARRVSFRAMRRYLPELTEEEALALRWLFLSRENRPVSISPNLMDLASQLVRSFLHEPGHRGSARWVYQSFVLSAACRYRELESPRLRAAARRLVWEASLRTHNWTLPLRWFRQLLRQWARPARG
jgi:glycosyltransferase involved in cell wall biosynthesis